MVTVVMILFMAVGCGGADATTTKNEKDGLKVNVSILPNNSKQLTFEKTSLELDTLILSIFKDGQQLVGKPFSKDDFGKWSIRLNGIPKNTSLVFVADGFNSANEYIYSGRVTKNLSDISNNINIGLTQRSSIDENILPSIETLQSYKDANNNIKVSFKIKNSAKEALQWQIFDKTSETLSSDFSENEGSTSLDGQEFLLTYSTNQNSENSYVLKLITEDTILSYPFTVTADENQANITVSFPPLPTKLNILVESTTIILSTVIDQENLLYDWKILEGASSVGIIEDNTLKSIRIPSYGNDSDFKIKLTLKNSITNASSSVIYHVAGNYVTESIENPDEGTCATQLFTGTFDSQLTVLDLIEHLVTECELILVGRESIVGNINDFSISNASLSQILRKTLDGRYLYTLDSGVLTVKSIVDGACATRLFTGTFDSQLTVLDLIEHLVTECELILVGKENINGQIRDFRVDNVTLRGILDETLKDRFIYTLGGNTLSIYPVNQESEKVSRIDE